VPTSDEPGRPPARTKQHDLRAVTAADTPLSPTDRPTGPGSRRELWLVAALCVAAAARIWFGAAALPFFADTDENAHFDVIHKYARGYWPDKKGMRFDPETVDTWIFDGSPEFLNEPGSLGVPGGYPPPIRDWQKTTETGINIRQQRATKNALPNHEAHEPPVYYALAAAWYECGRAFGLPPANATYWVRFLNAPLYAALVASSYVFTRPYFGREIGLAVPALTAFFPNTVFFTVNNDVLSPLPGVLTLLVLLRWCESESARPGLAAGAGALAATAVLVKLTNAAVLVPVGAAMLLRFRRAERTGRAALESLALLTAVAVPLVLWGLRNRLVLGDWTGTEAKALVQTWTRKPVTELLHHPVFTVGGAAGYLKTLCVSFFTGDAGWDGRPVHFLPAEYFFLVTAPLLPAIGLAAAFWRGASEPRMRLAAGMSALFFVASVVELAVISLQFDFGTCPFPSNKFPFFAFGRLAGGALVPFLALYACGAEAIVGRRLAGVAVAVAATVVMMALMQLAYLRLVVSSQFNWFHLP
jgi:hypothetical protein